VIFSKTDVIGNGGGEGGPGRATARIVQRTYFNGRALWERRPRVLARPRISTYQKIFCSYSTYQEI
jgi:hypothetical protein